MIIDCCGVVGLMGTGAECLSWVWGMSGIGGGCLRVVGRDCSCSSRNGIGCTMIG